MEIISEILTLEWDMFQKVNNLGGRASCQDNFETFKIMRKAQLSAWDLKTIESYKNDLEEANKINRNLISEKYARMMEYTHNVEYEKLKDKLFSLNPTVLSIVEKILQLNSEEEEKLKQMYPYLRKRGRQDNGREVSVDIYLKGELLTYSEKTLNLLLNHMINLKKKGESLAEKINENMVKEYGYSSLEQAEEMLKQKNKGEQNE